MGGEIQDVDPVRDRFTLRVFGGRPVRILFDERTRVYRDGARISVLNLRPAEHASVETTLDGASIFALDIHMLSQHPQGECEGQVLSYDPVTGKLTINTVLSREPVTLRVPVGTPVALVGQDAHSASVPHDPFRGEVVDVKFDSGRDGMAVATRIDILSTPGLSYVFSGDLSFLDIHSGRLVIVDPRDKTSYQVFFNPSVLPENPQLREGSHVRVTAHFDGSRYIASEISIE